jgi:hypothetical protein
LVDVLTKTKVDFLAMGCIIAKILILKNWRKMNLSDFFYSYQLEIMSVIFLLTLLLDIALSRKSLFVMGLHLLVAGWMIGYHLASSSPQYWLMVIIMLAYAAYYIHFFLIPNHFASKE